MSLADKQSSLQLPDRMRSKLEDFQKRVWLVKLAEGLLAGAFGLILSYLVVFALDRFFETPGILRLMILLTGSVGVGIWFPMVCHRWIWRNRSMEQVARLLRFGFPRLSDHLLGIIELVKSHGDQGRSEELCAAALNQVDNETKDKDFLTAVPFPRHKQWAITAGIPLMIAVAVWMVVPAAGINSFARWLTPWKEIERYTFAQIEPVNEGKELVVPIAEQSDLRVGLKDSSAWLPGTGNVSVGRQRLSADLSDQGYDFSIPALKESTVALVRAGDDWERVNVIPKPRPELESLTANIVLPAYLQRTSPVVKDIKSTSLSLLKGSQVSFQALASRDLAAATVNDVPLEISGAQLSTSVFDFQGDKFLTLKWNDQLGLEAKSPLELKLLQGEDERPSLFCQKLTKESVLMVEHTLSFKVSVQDDFGIKSVGIEWAGIEDKLNNPDPVVGEKVVASGGPEKTSLSDLTVALNPNRESIEPQTLRLRLFAVDFLPGRERAYSPWYTVYVLSKEDHAIWLTRRLDDWYKRAIEAYENEQQLYQRNIEIRNMTPEELNSVETFGSIRKQANSEKAQTRRVNCVDESW